MTREFEIPSQEQIDAAVARGRSLRSAAIVDSLRALTSLFNREVPTTKRPGAHVKA
ncbi:MAG: hypothetical protein AAGK00_03750 [Pseudomonadota bacterium]